MSEAIGEVIYIGPEGEEFSAVKFAYEAQRLERARASTSGDTLRALTHILKDFKEGHCEEDPEPAAPTKVQTRK